MRENLAKCFVNLRRSHLASQTSAKLRFYHRKGSFDIRALMIMLKEFFLIQSGTFATERAFATKPVMS
jgi:chorismate-pyruvate lyase